MPDTGAFRVTHPWGPRLPAQSRGSLPQEGQGGGDPVGSTGLWEGCALAGLSHLQPPSSQRMTSSQPGHRQSRDLEGKNHRDCSVQCWI